MNHPSRKPITDCYRQALAPLSLMTVLLVLVIVLPAGTIVHWSLQHYMQQRQSSRAARHPHHLSQRTRVHRRRQRPPARVTRPSPHTPTARHRARQTIPSGSRHSRITTHPTISTRTTRSPFCGHTSRAPLMNSRLSAAKCCELWASGTMAGRRGTRLPAGRKTGV